MIALRFWGGVGHDDIKKKTFYRLIGGHVELGEYTHDALLREIAEELDIDVTLGPLLTWHENIFTYNGKPGHEVIALYDVTITNPDHIRDTYTIIEPDHTPGKNTTYTASWVDIEDVKAGKETVYPACAVEFL